MRISNSICELMCNQIANEQANANLHLNIDGVLHMAVLMGFATGDPDASDDEMQHSRTFLAYISGLTCL